MTVMERWSALKVDLWLKALLKNMGLIMMRLSLLLHDSHITYLCCQTKLAGTSNGCGYCILNEDLKEEIYMEQPLSFVIPGKEDCLQT